MNTQKQNLKHINIEDYLDIKELMKSIGLATNKHELEPAGNAYANGGDAYANGGKAYSYK